MDMENDRDGDESLELLDCAKTEARRRALELESNPGLAITRDELWRRVEEPQG